VSLIRESGVRREETHHTLFSLQANKKATVYEDVNFILDGLGRSIVAKLTDKRNFPWHCLVDVYALPEGYGDELVIFEFVGVQFTGEPRSSPLGELVDTTIFVGMLNEIIVS
jgi:hypothetical protein